MRKSRQLAQDFTQCYVEVPGHFEGEAVLSTRSRLHHGRAFRSSFVIATAALIAALGVTSAPTIAAASQPATEGTPVAWGEVAGLPAAIPPDIVAEGITMLSSAPWWSLGVTKSGKVRTWYSDASPIPASYTPPASLDGKTVTAISAGGGHALALTADGKITTWGMMAGRLSGVPAFLPAELDGKQIVKIAAGGYHSLAVDDQGKVYVWGTETYVWGPGPNDKTDCSGALNLPAELEGERARLIAASPGDCTSIVVTESGKVVGWGGLGANPETLGLMPEDLDGNQIKQVSMGTAQAAVLNFDGKVTAWGRSDRVTDTHPQSDETITTIAVGDMHGVGVTTDNRVVSWGNLAWGRPFENEPVPTGAQGRIIAVGAGIGYANAIVADLADLGVTISAPTRLALGSTGSVNVRASNTGPSIARNVTYSASFPNCATLTKVQNNGKVTTVGTQKVVTWTTASLGVGQQVSSSLKVAFSPGNGCQTGLTSVLATTSAPTWDQFAANNTATAGIRIG